MRMLVIEIISENHNESSLIPIHESSYPASYAFSSFSARYVVQKSELSKESH